MFSLCIPTMDRFDFLKTYLQEYIENELIDEIIITDEKSDIQKTCFLKKKKQCL